MGQRLTPFLFALFVAGGLLAAVISAGRAARSELDQVGHYLVGVAEIDCEPPPSRTRDQFLGEVQYLGQLPDRLNRTDPESLAKLTDALSKHPSVEKVETVSLWPSARAGLRYRVPALVVAQRVLDRQGIVLPKGTPSEGLPVLRGKRTVTVASGELWPEQPVAAAAQIVAWLRGQLPNVVWIEAELTGEGLVLYRPDGSRVVWGGTKSDPPAATKLERLRNWTTGDIDLRKAG